MIIVKTKTLLFSPSSHGSLIGIGIADIAIFIAQWQNIVYEQQLQYFGDIESAANDSCSSSGKTNGTSIRDAWIHSHSDSGNMLNTKVKSQDYWWSLFINEKNPCTGFLYLAHCNVDKSMPWYLHMYQTLTHLVFVVNVLFIFVSLLQKHYTAVKT